MAFCIWPLSLSIVSARFTHVVGRSALLFYRQTICHDLDIPHFAHLTIRYRHPGCLYFSVIVNNAMNIRVKIFMWTRLQFSRTDRYRGEESLGPLVIQRVNSLTVFHSGCPISHPTSDVGGLRAPSLPVFTNTCCSPPALLFS